MTHLVVMEGDGIGPEITAATLNVLKVADRAFGLGLRFTPVTIGQASLRLNGTTLTDAAFEAARDADMERTARLAVVNLDWDHVRAAHLYKICASLVHPTAPRVPASVASSSSAALLASGGKRRNKRGEEGGAVPVARGRVLSVKVYPSDFGKARMAREEAEGPPAEIFKTKDAERPEEVNARTVYEVGGEDEYDEDALRKYQLERLR